mmetsp:Transcript_43145/g.60522  ORF Transcript_43145/g.60522 Transcript_43145/m.60522 type:complete len:136 (+) Transcript_43145:173-580(+)
MAKKPILAHWNSWYGVTCLNETETVAHIQRMNLHYNRLSGTIPSSLDQLFQLSKLHLNSNSLSGTIPSSLGQLFQLQSLHLYSNNFNGTIPSFLGKLSQLQWLFLTFFIPPFQHLSSFLYVNTQKFLGILVTTTT